MYFGLIGGSANNGEPVPFPNADRARPKARRRRRRSTERLAASRGPALVERATMPSLRSASRPIWVGIFLVPVSASCGFWGYLRRAPLKMTTDETWRGTKEGEGGGEGREGQLQMWGRTKPRRRRTLENYAKFHESEGDRPPGLLE